MFLLLLAGFLFYLVEEGELNAMKIMEKKLIMTAFPLKNERV